MFSIVWLGQVVDEELVDECGLLPVHGVDASLVSTLALFNWCLQHHLTKDGGCVITRERGNPNQYGWSC